MNEFSIGSQCLGVERAGPRLSEEQLASFEKEMGIRLPAQLRKFYQCWNGGLPYPVEVPETSSVWVRLQWPKGAENESYISLSPATSVTSLLQIHGEPPRDLQRTWNDFRPHLPPGMMPFSRDPGGGLFLIGIAGMNEGKIFFWQGGMLADVADSLEEFFLLMRDEPEAGESLEAWVRRAYV